MNNECYELIDERGMFFLGKKSKHFWCKYAFVSAYHRMYHGIHYLKTYKFKTIFNIFSVEVSNVISSKIIYINFNLNKYIIKYTQLIKKSNENK